MLLLQHTSRKRGWSAMVLGVVSFGKWSTDHQQSSRAIQWIVEEQVRTYPSYASSTFRDTDGHIEMPSHKYRPDLRKSAKLYVSSACTGFDEACRGCDSGLSWCFPHVAPDRAWKWEQVVRVNRPIQHGPKRWDDNGKAHINKEHNYIMIMHIMIP